MGDIVEFHATEYPIQRLLQLRPDLTNLHEIFIRTSVCKIELIVSFDSITNQKSRFVLVNKYPVLNSAIHLFMQDYFEKKHHAYYIKMEIEPNQVLLFVENGRALVHFLDFNSIELLLRERLDKIFKEKQVRMIKKPKAEPVPLIITKLKYPVLPNVEFDANYIENALKKWDNPVFKVKNTETRFFEGIGLGQTLTKQDLKRCKAICQFERRIIIAKLELASDKSVIAAFDQHAVDERIKLEKILERLNQSTTKLLKPIHTGINSCSDLELYGFYLKSINGKISINALPCSLEKRLVADLELLNEIVQELIKEPGQIPPKLYSTCQSVACRSAIMFGHLLTISECQSLLAKLTRCDFPFICAHGRTSIAPLFTY